MPDSRAGGIAIHVCADVVTSGVHRRWPPLLAARDTLARLLRISRQLGATEQHALSGERATAGALLDMLGSAAAGSSGPVIVTFTGHTERGEGPTGTARWCMRDSSVELSQIALHLARLPPAARVLLICSTCYAAAITEVLVGIQPVVVVAGCGAEQMMVDRPRSEFVVRLEEFVCAQQQRGPLDGLRAALEADTPDCERPVVWSSAGWHDGAL